jgi:hypothetical protein
MSTICIGVSWRFAIRARLALFVLLSELVIVLAPSSAARVDHRATVDVVTTHATSARLPKDGETNVRRVAAGDHASGVLFARAPVIASASWEHASFVTALERSAVATTCEPRARGPPRVA